MNVTNFFIPSIVLFVLIYAYIKKTDIYDNFIAGAKEGLSMSANLFPTILLMLVSINVFLGSGAIDYIINILEPVLNIIKFPKELLPLSILRPVSGSSAIALLDNILRINGPDSFIGRTASIIVASTETTIYVIMLYFGSIGIKKIKYSLLIGLLTDLFAVFLSLIVIKTLFY